MSDASKSLVEHVFGVGRDVVLVHGGMTDGPLAWFAQKPLAERWTVRVVDRAGYGKSSELSAGEDVEFDASRLVAALRGATPVHLVGHSSGAIVALLVAAAAPEAVRSLVIVEPPAYRFMNDAEVQHLADAGDELWGQTLLSDGEWLMRFFEVYGEDPPSTDITQLLEPHVSAFRKFVRRPWDIALPIERLRRAEVPTLVISGGHDAAFERLNDHVAAVLGARRAVVEGAGHEVQTVGQPFNDVLAGFWAEVESEML
ncbi:MAG TPA: alpha/beta hydrolase [Thermomicrobiales bacterium]|nr:alpha/beta hydrolase [Thermomicrobiales bacterium]